MTLHVNHAATLPIKMWLPEGEEIDPAVLTQAQNLANLPCARAVALMPDTHLGYGMPIGGMLATERAVVPNAVGVDIGCGMMAAKLPLKASMLSREQLQTWRIAAHSRIPVGFAGHEEPNDAVQRLDADYDKLVGPADVSTTPKLLSLVRHQIGTLGGGNHFIELQADVESEDVWLMLHSGSRGLGKAICDAYAKIAKEMCKAFGTPLADPDLAYLPQDLPVFFQYMSEMQFAMRFAEENRAEMWRQSLYALAEAIEHPLGDHGETGPIIETHHNFAAFEKHMGKTVIVHRKGAVKAEAGTLVTIPGSMGTASYIGRGLGSRESFLTCSHGAGRVLGRKQANRTLTEEQCRADMEKAGTVFGMRSGQFDEMPACYKDIDAVMEAQRELVEPVTRLRPLAVVKG